MAATARKTAAALAAAALFAVALRADEASDALAAVNRVAIALSANNPAAAIAQFDSSYPDYNKLKDYFIGLTGAYNITSEATIVDQQVSPGVANLTLDWTLTLTQPNTSLSKQRSSKITVRLVRKQRKWRIVSFSPIEIFNPAISSR